MNHEGVEMAKAKEGESGKLKGESTAAKKISKKDTETESKAKKLVVEKNSKKIVESAESDSAVKVNDDSGQTEAYKKSTAKAGKRSSKSVKEAEAKAVKEALKSESNDVVDAKPKKIQTKAKSKLERRSKGYRKVAELIDRDKTYDLKDALDKAIKTSPVKFDATVELHINLNVDPRQADQNIRGTVILPAGTGKSLRIAVFADEEDVKKAQNAGADIAAGDDFLKQLDSGNVDFDVLISTSSNMPKLGKYARLLGPKGLMPNPKSGTVTNDIAKAVKEAKAGRVEYRVDSTAIVHIAVGKVSFGSDKLHQNTQAVIASIVAAKPQSIKGNYIKSSFVSTTMGPSIRVNIS